MCAAGWFRGVAECSPTCQTIQRARCRSAAILAAVYPENRLETPDFGAGPSIYEGTSPKSTGSLRAQQRPQHVLQDAAVPEVLLLLGRVDPHDHAELPVVGPDRQFPRNRIGAGDALDGEHLPAG